MPVTIKEHEHEAAGVSHTTHSNPCYSKINQPLATKQKNAFAKAMKELSYHPSLNARSSSSYTRVIGLVLPDDDSDAFYQNPFFPSVLRSISQVASQNHYAHSDSNRER